VKDRRPAEPSRVAVARKDPSISAPIARRRRRPRAGPISPNRHVILSERDERDIRSGFAAAMRRRQAAFA
jgi:hypothetical protein